VERDAKGKVEQMTDTQENKPAFVLIPGAGGMASYWHRVVPLLRAAGHDAIAVDLPGDDPQAGLPEYARLVRAAMAGRTDVVLVAQSLGGFTAPLAAAPPVSAIVFVNAMIPVPGETPGAWWEATGQAKARIAAAERDGYGTDFDLPTYFFHDVPDEVLASGEESRDEADVVFGSVCDFADWPAIPVKVAAGADDRLFPVEFQQRIARERLGVEADVLPGGHLIALSRPEPLARYLVAVSGLHRYGPA
jgi:pimeloyl-ACP methyl ester carboxylesterase